MSGMNDTAMVAAITVGSLIVSIPPAHADLFEAVWTGGAGNGLYSSVMNWDLGAVPCNDIDTFNVTIDTTGDVFMDVDDACTVTDLFLGAGQRFRVGSGHIFTVLDDATVNGTIMVDNSSFLAETAGASFGDNENALLEASGGGLISIAATTYSSAALGSDFDLFVVSGAGSRIDLSSLQTLDAGFNGGGENDYHLIQATTSATIDLSALQIVTGPVRPLDRLDFVMTSDATIPLPSLQEIVSAGEGNVRFDLSIASYTFPSLLNVEDAEFRPAVGTDVTLPLLTHAGASAFIVPSDASVAAPRLLAMTGTTLDVAVGGAFSAPLCETFTYSVLTIEEGQSLVLPSLLDIEGSSFTVRGGETFAVAATRYDSSMFGADLNILTVEGGGTIVDWSSVNTIDAGYLANLERVHTIDVGAGAILDLSGVGTIIGPNQANDRIDLTVTDAQMSLTSLAEVRSVNAGPVRLYLNVSSYGLPSLVNAEYLQLFLRAGCALDAPALVEFDHGCLDLPPAASVSVPLLQSFTASALSADGSSLPLSQVIAADDSTFDLSGGATFTMGMTSYSSANRPLDWSVITAAGAGTLADWSSVTSLSAAFSDNDIARSHRYTAGTGATVDLSAVVSVTTPVRAEDAMVIEVTDGASMDLRSLATWTGGGALTFTAAGSGSLLDLGSFTVFDRSASLDVTSSAEVRLADLVVAGTGSIVANDDASGYPSLVVSGSVRNEIQNETAFRTGDARLTLTGGIATFEAVSEDLGAVAPAPDTFEFGEFAYAPGSDGPGVVTFVDNFDNGNRGAGPMPESVYFTGHDGSDAITSLGGGTLVLRNLNVYTYFGDTWINLQDLTPKMGTVPFLDGFLTNSLEAFAGDVNVDMSVDFQDLALILSHWGSGNPFYDLDGDDVVGFGDLIIVLAHWGVVTL